MTYAIAMPDTQGGTAYLTRGDGDPPRTYDPSHANRYRSLATAKAAMTRARRMSPLKERRMNIVEHPLG